MTLLILADSPDVGLYGGVAGLLSGLFLLLNTVIPKLLNRPKEMSEEKRTSFEKIEAAYAKLLDEREESESKKDKDLAACRQDGAEKQGVIDKLRTHNQKLNETLAMWSLELNRPVPVPLLDAKGDPR